MQTHQACFTLTFGLQIFIQEIFKDVIIFKIITTMKLNYGIVLSNYFSIALNASVMFTHRLCSHRLGWYTSRF